MGHHYKTLVQLKKSLLIIKPLCIIWTSDTADWEQRAFVPQVKSIYTPIEKCSYQGIKEKKVGLFLRYLVKRVTLFWLTCLQPNPLGFLAACFSMAEISVHRVLLLAFSLAKCLEGTKLLAHLKKCGDLECESKFAFFFS
jgi:hypothetical protein